MEIRFDEVFELLRVEEVVFAGSGQVYQRHAGFNAVFDIEIGVEVFGGPKVDERNPLVAGTDAINTPEALDDTDGVPVDVIVDEKVAILQVLAF